MNESFQQLCYAEARKWGDLSAALYSPNRASLSGADPISGERYRLVARAFRDIGGGGDVEKILNGLAVSWSMFCQNQQVKIVTAPKIKSGPSAGLSSMHYKHAGEGEIDGNIIYIRNSVDSFLKRIKDEKHSNVNVG